MGPSQRQRRRLTRCRRDHTFATGYRVARRHHPAGGRLEHHSELRVGRAAGSAAWLICDRSRELIRVVGANEMFTLGQEYVRLAMRILDGLDERTITRYADRLLASPAIQAGVKRTLDH